MATSTALEVIPKVSLGELLTPRPMTIEEVGRLRELFYSYDNIYVAEDVGFQAEFANIIVVEDEFKSGYECQSCDATGQVKCTECDDGSSRVNHEIKCKVCQGDLLMTCPTCKGKKEFIVVPDNAKRRPTSGHVVSVGPEVTRYKRGDYVLYSSFCGEVMDLTGLDGEGRERKVVIRFLKERETISRMHGQMTMRRIRKQEFQISG
jgi:hypothetical protein